MGRIECRNSWECLFVSFPTKCSACWTDQSPSNDHIHSSWHSGHRAALKLLEKMPQSTNQRFHNRCRAQGRAAFFISTSCYGPKMGKRFPKNNPIFFQYDPVSSSQDHLFTIRCKVVLCLNSTVIHSHILITIIKLISLGSNTLCNKVYSWIDLFLLPEKYLGFR